MTRAQNWLLVSLGSLYIFALDPPPPILTPQKETIMAFFILRYVCHLSRSKLSACRNFVNNIINKANQIDGKVLAKVPSDFKTRKVILDFWPIEPISFDICENGCMLFDSDHQLCQECATPRYQSTTAAAPKARRKMKVITISSQISLLIYHKKTRDLLERPSERNQHGIYGDIFSGAIFRTLLVELGSKDFAVYTGIYIDGFASKNRADHSLVLVHLVVFNFPESIRYKTSYMMDYCIFPGPASPKKKHYWTFLTPLLQELSSLENFGIKVFCDDGVARTMKVYCLFRTGDLPGVSPLAGHSGHTSHTPCRICTIVGGSRASDDIPGRYINPTRRARMRQRQDFVNGDIPVSIIYIGVCYPHMLTL